MAQNDLCFNQFFIVKVKFDLHFTISIFFINAMTALSNWLYFMMCLINWWTMIQDQR